MALRKYALIDINELTVLKEAIFEEGDPSLTLHGGKTSLWKWVPVVVTGNNEFNELSHKKIGPTVTVTINQVTQAYTIRPYTQDESDEVLADKVAAIKAEANRRILAIMPEHHQRNSMARGLANIAQHGLPPNWPVEEQAELVSVLTKWMAIKAVRDRSDELEADIPEDALGRNNFDPLAGWD